MKVHLQINPGGTFPVTACGRRILRCYAGKNPDVRPSLAFAVTRPDQRCKRCVAAMKRKPDGERVPRPDQ